MRFQAILNRDGGTLRTTDLDAFAARAEEVLSAAGHTLKVEVTGGRGVAAALQRAAADSGTDVVMAGGGDGTVSAAAAAVAASGKALAVLPAGTMNLFARSLGIPFGLDAALAAFAGGRIRAVDMASANGRPFVHQFSLGLHPRLVEARQRMAFSSRLGKIGASLRAAFETMRSPTTFRVAIDMDGRKIVAETAGLSVSNNLFGEGHLPFADRPDGGVLGVYVTSARSRPELLLLCFHVAFGRFRDSAHIDVHEAARAVVTVAPRGRRRLRCIIDGELFPLDAETEILVRRKALSVLVPQEVDPTP